MRFGLVLVVLLGGAAAAAPIIAPYDPLEISAARLEPPSGAHVMGTDVLGRDVFSRVLFGARLSLGAALLTLTLIVAIGLTMGVVAGYYGGWLDAVLMRVTDLVLVLPELPLLLLVGALSGGSVLGLPAMISALFWPIAARIIRSQVLTLRTRTQVRGRHRLRRRHVAPAAPPDPARPGPAVGGRVHPRRRQSGRAAGRSGFSGRGRPHRERIPRRSLTEARVGRAFRSAQE